jgi:phosphohistidine phosphatase SixA
MTVAELLPSGFDVPKTRPATYMTQLERSEERIVIMSRGGLAHRRASESIPKMPAASLRRLAVAAVITLIAAGGSRGEELSGSTLVTALRQGGYVLLMRHTSSPNATPDKTTADPENVTLERQLDQVGRDTARAMGEAIKKLSIPIGDVLSSPTYRALETVRLASLGRAQTFPELGDGGQSMQAVKDASAAWLRNKVFEAPPGGTDTVIVTHMPNIVAAFGLAANAIVDGETMVFRPDGRGGAELVARVKVEEWPALASPP